MDLRAAITHLGTRYFLDISILDHLAVVLRMEASGMSSQMCVYVITQVASGRQYVGSTSDFHSRVQGHQYALRHQRYENRRLQEDWNSFGATAFEFAILEEVTDQDRLVEVEAQWMVQLEPYYNARSASRHRRHTPVMGIYAITHTETGTRYIGSSKDIVHRFSQHKPNLRQGKSGHAVLQRAWSKYGEDAFTFDILEAVSDKADLLAAEQRWIDSTPLLYNRTRMAGTPKGFKRDEATVVLLRTAAKRRVLTPQEKARRAEALRRYWNTPEAREKNSEQAQAYWSKPEARQAQSERRKRYFQSEEARRQRSEQQKRVMQQQRAARLAKMTPDKIQVLRARHAAGEGIRRLSQAFDVSRSTVEEIVHMSQ